MMQFGRRTSHEVLSMPRTIARSSGRGLLAPGGHRRQLHILPEGQRVWVPDSFHGTSAQAMNGSRSFMWSEVEAATDHFKKMPLLRDVPTDRLMVPDPSRPYFIEDDGNCKIRSGLWLIHSMHEMGLSSKGLFVPENVIVLPKKMEFGLKEIDLSATGSLSIQEKVDEFVAYIRFLVDDIKEVQGAAAAAKLPPVFLGLQTLANELLLDPTLIEMLLDYADLLPIHSKGILYRRIYNILVQRVPWLCDAKLPVVGFVPDPQMPLDTAKNFATRLIQGMPYGVGGPSNDHWGNIAQRNVDVYKCITTVSQMAQNKQQDFVKMMRVGSSHPVEEKMAKLIAKIKLLQTQTPTAPTTSSSTTPMAPTISSPTPTVSSSMAPTAPTTSSPPLTTSSATTSTTPPGPNLSADMQKRAPTCSLLANPPSCTEVLRLLDDSYPKYPSGAARVFWVNKVYGWLNMRSLFPRMP